MGLQTAEARVLPEHGVLFGSARPNIQVIRSPPPTVGHREIGEAVTALDSAIEAAF